MNKIFNYIIIGLVALIIIVLIISLGSNNKKEPTNFDLVILDNDLSISLGSSYQINYTVDSTEQLTVFWESSSPEIAKVDANGIITGLNYGNSTITGKIIYNDKTVEKTIQVKVISGDKNAPITNAGFPKGFIILSKNRSYTLPFSIEPSNGYIESINYHVDNPRIISLENGVITGVSVGETKVTVNVNNRFTSSIDVKVTDKDVKSDLLQYPDNVILSDENVSLLIGDKKTISYTVEPNNAYLESINWESSNPSIVQVDKGNITALKEGEATITLTINDNIFKKCHVKVTSNVIKITKITINNKISVYEGNSQNISYTLVPSNATTKDLVFTSSDSTIATVTNTGTVKGVKKGTTTIKVATSDGRVTAYCFVEVNKKSSPGGGGGGGSTTFNTNGNLGRATKSFFQNIATKTSGSSDTLSSGESLYVDGTFYMKDGSILYKYVTNDSSVGTLSSSLGTIKVNFYLPKDKLNSSRSGLSSLKTIMLLGGSGEVSSGDSNSNIQKVIANNSTDAIVIVPRTNSGSTYSGYFDAIVSATRFTNAFSNTSFNSIIGCSEGAISGLNIASRYNYYKRVVAINGYLNLSNSYKDNLKNKEIIIISSSGDNMYWDRHQSDSLSTRGTIDYFINHGFGNVTVITDKNNTKLINRYSGKNVNLVYSDINLSQGHGPGCWAGYNSSEINILKYLGTSYSSYKSFH